MDMAGKKEKAKAKVMGVAKQEKGANVVRFQDGITQYFNVPWRRDTHNVIKILIGICSS
jgi:hypothetical protein